MLEIDGDAGPITFRALLMPLDYVVVDGLPADRLKDVAAGTVVISPPDGSGLPEQRVGTAGMRVFSDASMEKAIVAIKLRLAVATVSISLTGDEFHELVAQHNQDVVAALGAAGITTQLLPPPLEPPIGHQPDRPQPPHGWAPFIPPGYALSWGPCCWWHFCEC